MWHTCWAIVRSRRLTSSTVGGMCQSCTLFMLALHRWHRRARMYYLQPTRKAANAIESCIMKVGRRPPHMKRSLVVQLGSRLSTPLSSIAHDVLSRTVFRFKHRSGFQREHSQNTTPFRARQRLELDNTVCDPNKLRVALQPYPLLLSNYG